MYQHVEADVYQRVEADDRNSDDYYTVYLTVKRLLVQQLLFFPRCSSYASGSTHVLACRLRLLSWQYPAPPLRKVRNI